MDRRSKLLSAIAFAAITSSFVEPAAANTPEIPAQEELYLRCLEPALSGQEQARACSCFLSRFPDSQFAPAIFSRAIALASDAGCGAGALRYAGTDEPAEIY